LQFDTLGGPLRVAYPPRDRASSAVGTLNLRRAETQRQAPAGAPLLSEPDSFFRLQDMGQYLASAWAGIWRRAGEW